MAALQLLSRVRDAHAAGAAHRRLDDHRVAEPPGQGAGLLRGLRQRADEDDPGLAAFSERKPRPGWMASVSCSRATPTIPAMSR
jgi:hypothetical protein